MKNRKIEKYVLVFCCGLFLTVGAFFFILFGQTYREYTNIKSREVFYQERLAEMEAKLKEKEETLHRLHNDPDFVERVIRQRLGYVKADELVFRFEDLREVPEPSPSRDQ